MNNIEECKMVPITELLECIVDNRGKSCPTCDEGFPLIATNCIKHSSIYPTFENIRYVSDETLKTWFRAELKPNDILFVNKGTPGRVCLVPDPITFCAAQDMIGLRADSKKIYYKYLFAVLRSNFIQEKIANFHVGIAIPHFKKSDMDNLLIPVPDIYIQKKIGDMYCELSEKIENNNKINAELESMAKTIYDYWFLQFEFPNEEGKPYKSSGGKMVWNEELKREIPEGWEVVQIGKILDKYPKTESVLRDDYEKGILFPIIDQSKDFICGYTDDKDKVLHLKDAIVFGDHTNFAKYINFDFARGADGTQIVVSKNKNLPNYLLYLQIISLPVIEQGYSRHFKFLKEQFVFVPNKIVSEKYMKIIEDALLLIKKNVFENRELASLRDFLLPMLMNGQVGFKE